MLSGKTPLSIKDAVFYAENAYYDNQKSYEAYNRKIQEMANLCRLKMKQLKLNPNDELVKNMMIFAFMTDTFEVKLPNKEQTLTHYPMRYDFDDPGAKKNFSKYFVTKLVDENTGQCHSLPLLYLILANELKTKANLSLSPKHTFIKIQDNRRYWHNLELTSGAILSNYHYLNSGFIKSEALRKGLYMDTLSTKEVVANVMVDLVRGYVKKYGYDEFVKQCLDAVLSHYPDCLHARMIYANFHTARFHYVAERNNFPPVQQLNLYPQASALYKLMLDSYATIDNLGYEEMPDGVYADWLNQVKKEKSKSENQQRMKLKQTIK